MPYMHANAIHIDLLWYISSSIVKVACMYAVHVNVLKTNHSRCMISFLHMPYTLIVLPCIQKLYIALLRYCYYGILSAMLNRVTSKVSKDVHIWLKLLHIHAITYHQLIA